MVSLKKYRIPRNFIIANFEHPVFESWQTQYVSRPFHFIEGVPRIRGDI